MTNDPLTITENDISTAWGRVFLQARESGVQSISPLVMTITPRDDPTPERPDIRTALDDRIASLKVTKYAKLQSVHTVANTIFPASFWNPNAEDGAERLYERFKKTWPRIKKCRPNYRGSYFRRMTAYRPKAGDRPVNQLKHIVETYKGGNHRRSALQAAIFDPALDHNNSRQLGFPCLHQVSFSPVGEDGLAITGYYAMQYIFDRAYGNYLGLCRLGHFMATQLGKRLSRMTCIAATAGLGTPNKGEVSELAATVEALVDGAGEVAA